MSDFLDLVHDPKHRHTFEKLLRLAAKRGDADLVAERLSWGIDPNGSSKKGTTALIANARSFCPSVATVKALLDAGADPTLTDEAGLTALDYSRRKLMKIQSRPRQPQLKSPSLDENNQVQLSLDEQAEVDEMRKAVKPEDRREFMAIWWEARRRAARRKFNDANEIDGVVELLEAAVRRPR